MNFISDHLFFAVFVAFGSYFLYQVVTKGFKGAMFGGKIDKTYGQIEPRAKGVKITIHRIASEYGTKVGIELMYKSLFNLEMDTVTLTKQEAKQLIQLLTQATNET